MWMIFVILAGVLGVSVAHAGEEVTHGGKIISREGGYLCVQFWPNEGKALAERGSWYSRIVCGLELPPDPGREWAMITARECSQTTATDPWKCWVRPELAEHYQRQRDAAMLLFQYQRQQPPVPNWGLEAGRGALEYAPGGLRNPLPPPPPPTYQCRRDTYGMTCTPQ